MRNGVWGCTSVLMYLPGEFSKEDWLFKVIGRALKVQDPKWRPSLLEWESWSDVASVRKAGKGKASQPAGDTMEAYEGMGSPKAKKLRLAGPNQKREWASPELNAP